MARPAWLAPTLRGYRREWFPDDLLAGLVLAVLLLPQSLAYAMLAGLPPHFGLYASIFPVLAYALIGSSTLMAVGPVAVVALMNMTTLAPLATPGSEHYIALSAQLAWLSGAILLVLGWLRLGFLARLLSHAVMGGFVTGAALLIVIGQLPGLLGVPATGATALDQLTALMSGLGDAHRATAALGFTSLLLLVVGQRVLPRCLLRFGLSMRSVQLSSRLWPLVVVALATTIVALAELGTKHGVPVVGVIPSGIALPAPVWPTDATSSGLWRGALAIALVSFVESVSVAQALALRRRERVRPDAELLGEHRREGEVAGDLGPVPAQPEGVARGRAGEQAGHEQKRCAPFGLRRARIAPDELPEREVEDVQPLLLDEAARVALDPRQHARERRRGQWCREDEIIGVRDRGRAGCSDGTPPPGLRLERFRLRLGGREAHRLALGDEPRKDQGRPLAGDRHDSGAALRQRQQPVARGKVQQVALRLPQCLDHRVGHPRLPCIRATITDSRTAWRA